MSLPKKPTDPLVKTVKPSNTKRAKCYQGTSQSTTSGQRIQPLRHLLLSSALLCPQPPGGKGAHPSSLPLHRDTRAGHMGVLQGFATKRPDPAPGDGGEPDTLLPSREKSGPLQARGRPPTASGAGAVAGAVAVVPPPAAAPSAAEAEAELGAADTRAVAAGKHLVCGGVAGSVAKTVTAPFSRLTILYQVHSLVTTKGHRPRFAMSMTEGVQKIVERGGVRSLWKGNGTSVLHRFPFSAINFFVYENVLDGLNGRSRAPEDEDGHPDPQRRQTTGWSRLVAGATAGSMACVACYPLDLVRTRLTTELEGRERYRGMVDAFRKIHAAEGFGGFYSGIGPTLAVAVPSFAISYCVYGSLKEYVLDDDLFYNLRKVDVGTGEEGMGFALTLGCGALSGIASTLTTFPFDTVRRRMQIQNLHLEVSERRTGPEQLRAILTQEGVKGMYRGLPPELLKVVPMVGTMFLAYEYMKDLLQVRARIL